MTRLRRLRRLLLTPVGKRVPVGKNGAPHGVALMLVMLALALMSAVVTDLGANELVRYRLACNDRDALKAQLLTDSGVNIARLLLSVQSAVQPMITQLAASGIPLPAHTVWQLVPMDSEILKGLTSGELQNTLGLPVDDAVARRHEAKQEIKDDNLRDFDAEKEGAGDGPFEAPEGGFGAFDGQFLVDVQDEEQKAVSLRGWGTQVSPAKRFETAQRLFAVFKPERYDFLFEERDSYGQRTDRNELVADVYDWIDDNQDGTDALAQPEQWGRQISGVEDSLYTGYPGGLTPKNAYFDSHAELAMVRGMDDAHMKAFGDAISIYGENKVNILSAPLQSIEALLPTCAANLSDPLLFQPIWVQETLTGWQQWKALGPLGGGGPITPDGFISYLESRGLVLAKQRCKDSIDVESKNFTVRSTAQVGDVSRTTTMVMRIYGSLEEIYFYSVR